MAEVKLNNLLRLYRLRSKFDAVILAVHACLVERGFRCINSGEEVRLYCSTIQWTAAQKHELENAQVAKMLSSLLCQTQDKLTTMTNWAYFNLQWGFKLYFTSFPQRNAQQECDFGETLPPDWNSLDDVYALQYRRGNLSSVFIFKALRLGDKLMLYLMVCIR